MESNHKYYQLLEAIKLAWGVHEGQTRRDGVTPYITHPLTVMLHMDSYDEKIVAVLHDTIEDNPSFPGLYNRLYQFGADIFRAIFALTRKDELGELYVEYIKRVCKNELARAVKLVDIEHNLSTTHPSKTKKIEQYNNALKIIHSSIKGEMVIEE